MVCELPVRWRGLRHRDHRTLSVCFRTILEMELLRYLKRAAPRANASPDPVPKLQETRPLVPRCPAESEQRLFSVTPME